MSHNYVSVLEQNVVSNKCNSLGVRFDGLTIKCKVDDGIYYFKALCCIRFTYQNTKYVRQIETYWERSKQKAKHFMRALGLQFYYSISLKFLAPLIVERDDDHDGLQYRAFYHDGDKMFATSWYDSASDALHTMNCKLGASYRIFFDESDDDDDDDGINVILPACSSSSPENVCDSGYVAPPNSPVSLTDSEIDNTPIVVNEHVMCVEGEHDFRPMWVEIWNEHTSECKLDCHTFCDVMCDFIDRNDSVCVKCGKMNYDLGFHDLKISDAEPQMLKAAANLIPGVAEASEISKTVSSIAQGISSLSTSSAGEGEHAPAVTPQLGDSEVERTTQVAMETGIVIDAPVATVSRPGSSAVNQRSHGIGVSNVPELLDRYFISSLVWTPGASSSVFKIPTYPFSTMVAQHNPSMLSFFSYLLAKFGVEITVTLNAAPFYKGCMKVGVVYSRSAGDTYAYNTTQFANMSGALIHASEGGSRSFVIKYFCVQNAIVIKKVTPKFYNDFAALFFCPLVSLESVDGSQKDLTFNLNWKMTTFEFPTQLAALVPYSTATPQGAVCQNFVPVTGPSLSSTKDDHNYQLNLAETCKNETINGDPDFVKDLHSEFKNSFSLIGTHTFNSKGNVCRIPVCPLSGPIANYPISPSETLNEWSTSWSSCLASNYQVAAGFMEYKFVFVKGESCNCKIKLAYNFTTKAFDENEARAAPGVYFDLTTSLEWTARAPLLSPFSAIPLSKKLHDDERKRDFSWSGCTLELWTESDTAHGNNVPADITVLVFDRASGVTFMCPTNVIDTTILPYYSFGETKESHLDLRELMEESREIPFAYPQAPITEIEAAKPLPDCRFFPGTVVDPCSCDGQMVNLTRNCEEESIDRVLSRPFRREEINVEDNEKAISFKTIAAYPPTITFPNIKSTFYNGTQRDLITMSCVGVKADTRLALVAPNSDNVYGVAGRFVYGQYINGHTPYETSLGSDFEIWNTSVNKVLNLTLPFNNIVPFVTGGYYDPENLIWSTAFENLMTVLSVEPLAGKGGKLQSFLGWENLKCFMPQCPPLRYTRNIEPYHVYEWQTDNTAFPQAPWRDVVTDDPYLRNALEVAKRSNHSVLIDEAPPDPTLDDLLKDMLNSESNFSFSSEFTAQVVYPESLKDIVSVIKFFNDLKEGDDVVCKFNEKCNSNLTNMHSISLVVAEWERQGKIIFRSVFRYYTINVWKIRQNKIYNIDQDMSVSPDLILRLIADRCFVDATSAVLLEAGAIPVRQTFLAKLLEISGFSRLAAASRRVMSSVRNNLVDPTTHLVEAIISRTGSAAEYQIREDESLWAYLVRLCGLLYPNLLTCILPLGHFMLEGSVSHKVLAALTVLASLGIIKVEHITNIISVVIEFCTKYYHYFTGMVRGEGDAVPQSSRADEIFESFKNVCLCVLPLIAGTLGFKAESARGWFSASSRSLRDALFTAGSLSRIFQFGVDTFKSFIRWCINERAPEVVAQEQLALVSEELCTWAKDVCDLCLPHMYDTISMDRSLQLRVMELRKKGHEYMNLMRDESVEYFRHFIRFKHVVEECYQQVCLRQGNNVPRIDPVCVWMYGPPGVGKTTLMKNLILKMLKASGVSHSGDAVYTYSPLTEYSNGYCGQPGIMLDDIFAINSPGALEKSLTFFHNLNSSIALNANMAALEDKHKTIHPYVVGVTANSFTVVSPSIVNKEAFNRRRDLVVNAKFSDAFIQKYPNVTTASDFRVEPKDLENNAHLVFKIHQSSHTESGFHMVGNNLELTYEQLEDFLKERAAVFIERRLRKWKEDNDLGANYLADNTSGVGFVREITSGAQSTLQSLGGAENDDEYADALSQTEVRPDATPNMPGPTVSMADVSYVANSLRASYRANALVGGAFAIIGGVRPTYDMLRSLRETVSSSMGVCVCDGSVAGWEAEYDQESATPCKHYFIQTHFAYCPTHHVFVDVELRKHISATACEGGDEFCPFGRLMKEAWLLARADNRRLQNLASEDLTNIGQPAVHPLRESVSRFRKLVMTMKRLSLGVWGWFKLNVKNGNLICAALSLIGICGAVHLWRNYVRIDDVSLVQKGIRNGTVEKNLDGLAIPTQVILNVKKGSDLQKLIRSDTVEVAQGPYSGPGVPRVPQAQSVVQTIHDATPNTQTTSKETEAFKGESTLIKSIAFICLPGKEKGEMKPLRIFMIGGQKGLMPAHYCPEIRKFEEVVIYSFLHPSPIPVRTVDLKMYALQTDDLAYIILPKTVGTFPLRTGMCNKASEMSKFSDERVLFEISTSGSRIISRIDECETVDIGFLYPGYAERKIRGYCYNYARDGLCGAILFDVKHQKILGMHVLSHTRTRFKGVSALMSQELLEQIVSDEKVIDRMYPPILEGEARTKVLPPGHLEIGKSVYAKQQIAGRNQIVESPLAEFLSENVCLRKPACFAREGDNFPGEQAMKIGVARQFDYPIPFEEQEYKEVKQYLSDWLIRQVKPIGKVVSVRSLYEGVMGIENNPYAIPLDFSTSMGYPWIATHHGKKKKSFFTFEERDGEYELIGMNEKLYEMIEHENDLRVRGVVPPTVFVDFLKDETLKPGKDPRLVNASSCQATIAHRMFLLDFMSALRASRHPGCAVGTNMDSGEVESFILEMFEIGDTFVDGDYKDFGPRIDPRLVQIVFECVNDWYDFHGAGEFNGARLVIGEEVGQAIHLVGDALFQTTIGSPSGFAFTAEMNSLANLLYLLLAYRHSVGSLLTFHENVYVETYGDDLLMSVSNRVRDVFNARTLSLFFKEHCIRFTDAQKNEGVDTRPYDSIDKVTFLKREFKYEPARDPKFRAALPENVIEEIPLYIKNNVPKGQMKEHLAALLFTSLYHAHARGAAYYNRLRGRYLRAVSQLNLNCALPFWEDIETLKFGDIGKIGYLAASLLNSFTLGKACMAQL